MMKKRLKAASSRLPWPDLARGIGIFLVLCGHSKLASDPFKFWIYSFHMPLFFFVSGCFMSLKEGSVRKTIIKRAYALLPCYFTYSVFRWAYACYANQAFLWKKLIGIFTSLPETDFDGYVWFFAGMFAAECLFALLLKLEKRPELPLLGTVLAAAAVLVWHSLGLPRIPWHADAACLLLPYAGLGWYLRKGRPAADERLTKGWLSIALLPVLLAVNLLTCWMNGKGQNWHIDYNLLITHNIATCYITGLAGVLFFYLLLRRIPDIPPLTFVGRNSSVYYCVGWIGATILQKFIYLFSIYPHGWVLLCVQLIGLGIVPVPLILLVNRYTPWLVGKKRTVKQGTGQEKL